MDKIAYFKISDRLKLPYRCPILDICERRFLSIYFNSYSDTDPKGKYIDCLLNKGIINKDSVENTIDIKGEEPSCIRGNTIKAFNNFCPEVNLFDDYHAFPFAQGTASVSGEWDEFRQKGHEFKTYKFGHFSECPEFNVFLSKERLTKKPRRIAISKQLRFEVLQRDNFTCQYCGRNAEEGIKLHVDHKIPVASGGKTEFSNLITSCEDCNLGKSNKSI
ncbi:hypothetical protein MASR1M74_16380 [Lentimicrobium sp.]